MRIILTNDDGIEAPGLLAMRQALEKVGEVVTVAPDQNRSGVGRSISIGRPLTIEECEMADGVMGYACSGTPVDCVRIVALGLLDFEPDVVVAGINHGENLGDDITYSGTVAGALEGIVIGVPGIAVSLSTGRAWHESSQLEEQFVHSETEMNFRPVAEFAARLAEVALTELPKERILNVNAPNLPGGKLKGARVTRLGRRRYRDKIVEVKGEDQRVFYDIYNNPPAYEVEDGTDFAALEEGRISVTPIHLDLTDRVGLKEIDTWDVDALFSKNGKRG
ncbi:surE: 5'/3'-nucleotidase SurE [Rubrobacter radiotolerans]|uniref:5'-nucleotidase SurE n=1 Tax=Rubrobacter radiotolerans TaxID=42256 RepID=A0A023X141_RUBRA|nr:5'/3'-nucleotidase SurE [Rubrobacter radiotolerans]AHY45784.1 surE: 5'/3'-nucleotidase SurE [Rubrobacter radiotolerans]MDX5893199.1 5'/3'-nucleotidase SurE [Rubrobacter radiotolerans]SMC03251.1 5'-nucleotidase /3'-nucleotidase /exopolyphosphatase [Rubrobacter radiotolerans DSM 5868]